MRSAPSFWMTTCYAASMQAELDTARAVALEAGELLLAHRRAGFVVEHKSGPDDPVTIADREASALILSRLQAAFPDDGLLSEEETDNPERLAHERVWIVDPIDGTREYTEGSPDYCVSIGLAVRGQAALGVLYAPDTGELWCGGPGLGVTKNGVPVQAAERQDYIISASETEYRVELSRLGWTNLKPSGSTALKLARISSYETDATFTMAPRAEWDLCGGDALIQGMGGVVQRRDGQPIRYNSRWPQIEQGFIAGRLEAVAWLGAELQARGVGTSHLEVKPGDAAAKLLGGREFDGDVFVRYSGQELRAMLVVQAGQVTHSEGDASQLERLTRDVVRWGVKLR